MSAIAATAPNLVTPSDAMVSAPDIIRVVPYRARVDAAFEASEVCQIAANIRQGMGAFAAKCANIVRGTIDSLRSPGVTERMMAHRAIVDANLVNSFRII